MATTRSGRACRWSLARLGLAALLGLLTALAATAQAAGPANTPAAGSLIGNQATATYTDEGGSAHTLTSNIVNVRVEQVAAFILTASQTKNATAGAVVSFPHTLTNLGNGLDTFSLALAQSTADNFDLTNLHIYADANGDGVADNATPLSSTGPLSPGGSFTFVVTGTVPGGTPVGNQSVFTVTGQSGFDPSQTRVNTDIVNVTRGAVLTVTKSLDVLSGPSPSGNYTYTIWCVNNGPLAATNVTFSDLLPTQMAYIPGSGRYSGTGTTPLTDALGGDPAGIAYDYGVTAPGTVTVTLATVPAGFSGFVSAQVRVRSGYPVGPIPNTAHVTYNDGTGAVVNTDTNTAVFTITGKIGVSFTGQVLGTVAQGSTVTFTNVLLNTGAATDTFNITLGNSGFPAGTVFTLYKSDGVTPLADTNGDGIPDTGPVVAGGTYNVIMKATLPPTASGTGPFLIAKLATSHNDPAIHDPATDVVNTIEPSTVDITNDKPLTAAVRVPGQGFGPETEPVTTLTADLNPLGSTLVFHLWVNNTSSLPDKYDLACSTDRTFGKLALPEGAEVAFFLNGTPCRDTGMIPAGGCVPIDARIFDRWGNLFAGKYDLYFRALSPYTFAFDIKHDGVDVKPYRRLSCKPDNSGQVLAGGSVVYTRVYTNLGNVVEGDNVHSVVDLTTANNTAGFSSQTFWDKNNNGVLDAGDLPVTNMGQFVGGTGGASTAAGLDPGESATVFTVVYCGSAVPVGTVDVTTTFATTTPGTYPVAAPAVTSCTDTTKVVASSLVIRKLQALDVDGNGTADTAFGTGTLSARPGACIRYQVSLTNGGTTPATSVVLSDLIPAFTTYHTGDGTTSPTGRAVWTVAGSGVYTLAAAPAPGGTGAVAASIGTLLPGKTVVLTFGVKIQP